MRARTTILSMGAVLLTGLGTSTAAQAAAPRSRPAHHPGRHVTVTTLISGLNAPRGIVVGRGTIYVAESGLAGPGAAGLTDTGRVSRYDRSWFTGQYAPTWSTGFESVYATEAPSAPPDALGPEGLSSAGWGCDGGYWDRRDHWSGCPISVILSESHDGVNATSKGATQTTQAGHVFTLNRRTGVATDRADVGDQNYAWTTANSALYPTDFPDANPYGLLVTRSHGHGRVRTFVVDAGANTVSEVMPDGTVRVIAYIPNETFAPFHDSTPTCAAMGPDGMLYVGTLDLIANLSGGGGKSSVWRVDPNADYPTAPTLWASGLTTVTACAFDQHGNFWATEMFADNGPNAAPGDLVRVDGRHPSQLTRIGGGQLPLPGGIAVGHDGSLYVTTNSASPVPGSGAVARVRY